MDPVFFYSKYLWTHNLSGSVNFLGSNNLNTMRFMVLKTTGLSLRFQRKNRFCKLCNGSRDITQNVSKYTGLVWRTRFWHILFNILGPGANFSKPIFALKA